MLLIVIAGAFAHGASEKSGASGKDVDLAFFTGKVETIDVIDEIMADYNALGKGITVEQEYQNDASNIIKIKFASGEVPDIMTTYEQEYVDQGRTHVTGNQSIYEHGRDDVRVPVLEGVGTGIGFRAVENLHFESGFFIETVAEGHDHAGELALRQPLEHDIDRVLLLGGNWTEGHAHEQHGCSRYDAELSHPHKIKTIL